MNELNAFRSTQQPGYVFEPDISQNVLRTALYCVQTFGTCLSQLEGILYASLDDQLARLKIWLHAMGVFSDTYESLDYRLRESLELRNAVLRRLETVVSHLKCCKSNRNPLKFKAQEVQVCE